MAALVHRSRHGGRRHGDRKIHQVAQRTGSRHGVRDDEHPFAHGASAESRAGGLPPALGHELVVPPESGHCRRMVRIVRVGDPKDSHAAVQQLARPLHHGLQDLVDGEPIDDPALQLRKPLEQHLALAKRVEESRILLGLLVGVRPKGALVLEDRGDQRKERRELLWILLRGHGLVRAFGWRYLVPDRGQIGGAGLSVGGRQLAGVVVLLARPVDHVGLDLQ